MTGSYEQLVGFLKSRAPDFANSAEYRLHKNEMDDLPGVILAAFGKYLARTARENGAVTPLLLILEEIAEWNDASAQESLRDELFEAIETDDRGERILRARMTGRLRDMYEQW